MINPKQKAELSDMFENSKEQAGGGINLPDGNYTFKIVDGGKFEAAPKPHYTHKAEVIRGGDDSAIGEVVEIRDNMETPDNMGWFKSRMARLNVTGLSFDDVEDGTLAEQLKGKVFEGQVKSKGGFANIYVNRLVSEASEEDRETRGSKKEEEEPEEKETSAAAFEAGDNVQWNSKGEDKEGEVVEVLEDEGLARVKKEDGSVVRVPLEKLKKAAAGKKDKDEEEEEEEEKPKGKKGGEEPFELPEPDAVEEMSMKDVKEALGALSFEAADVKQPRAVLHAFCTLGHDADAKIEVTEVAPLADALEVTLKKGATFKEQIALLSKSVQKRIG